LIFLKVILYQGESDDRDDAGHEDTDKDLRKIPGQEADRDNPDNNKKKFVFFVK
jgi:hypothetical protein